MTPEEDRIDPETRRRALAFWAEWLGCERSWLDAPGVRVFPHARLADWSGVHLSRVGPALLVSAPPGCIPALAAEAERAALGGWIDGVQLRRVLERAGFGVTAVVGPAWQGAARDAPAASPTVDVRVVDGLAAPELQHLRDAVRARSAEEWEHAALEGAEAPLCVAFADGRAAAAAGYAVLPGRAAHMGVVTHPEHRGRGLARAAAGAATRCAVEAGLLARWQTLAANAPSVAVARALGYRHFATTLALRLGSRAH